MKKSITLVVFAALLQGCFSSDSRDVVNMKDMNDNMMDMKIYQENLGDEIRKGNMDYAEWLATGLDSIMLVVSDKFTEHRKLKRSFYYHYKRLLAEPMKNIRSAIRQADTATAMRNYNLLVRKCNGCHIDHDIKKVVRY